MLGVGLLASGPAWSQVTISPPQTRVAIAPGGHALASVKLRNDSDQSVEAVVELQDWVMEGEGSATGLRYAEPGTLPGSCGKHVTVHPQRFVLEPKALQDLQLSLSLPEGASGTCHSAFVVTVGPVMSELPEGQSGVIALLAMGHLILVDADGAAHWAADLERFEVSRPDDTAPVKLDADFVNTGDATIRLAGEFAVQDHAGNLVTKVRSTVAMGFAGRRMHVHAEIDTPLAAGEYSAVGIFDIGGGKILSPEATFEVVDQLTVAEVRAPSAADAGITLVLANGGNITHAGQGTATVVQSGEVIQELALDPFVVLPGTELEVALPPLHPPTGPFELKVHVQTATAALDSVSSFVSSPEGIDSLKPAVESRNNNGDGVEQPAPPPNPGDLR